MGSGWADWICRLQPCMGGTPRGHLYPAAPGVTFWGLGHTLVTRQLTTSLRPEELMKNRGRDDNGWNLWGHMGS